MWQVILTEQLVKSKSRDAFYRSPKLKLLHGKLAFADCLLEPTTEQDVVRILGACAKLRLPVTPRGFGTCSYGGALPLEGGALLDLSKLRGVTEVDAHQGTVTAYAGTALHDLRAAAINLVRIQDMQYTWLTNAFYHLIQGWDLRVYPAHSHLASLGGFLSTAGFGIGSVRFGSISQLGNIKSLQIATLEEVYPSWPTAFLLALKLFFL